MRLRYFCSPQHTDSAFYPIISQSVDSAVEPTKSENITVTWRRSARSSGETLGLLGGVATSAEGALPPASVRRAAMFEKYAAVTDRTNADFFQVLLRQARQDPLVYLVFAECGLVPFEAQAPQPSTEVHDGALRLGA
jgi:hypothetical protein